MDKAVFVRVFLFVTFPSTSVSPAENAEQSPCLDLYDSSGSQQVFHVDITAGRYSRFDISVCKKNDRTENASTGRKAYMTDCNNYQRPSWLQLTCPRRHSGEEYLNFEALASSGDIGQHCKTVTLVPLHDSIGQFISLVPSCHLTATYRTPKSLDAKIYRSHDSREASITFKMNVNIVETNVFFENSVNEVEKIPRDWHNTCRAYSDVTIATVYIDADFNTLNVSAQLTLLKKFSSYLSLAITSLAIHPSMQVPTINDHRIKYLMEGTGNAESSRAARVTVLNWMVGCGTVLDTHKAALRLLQHTSLNSILAKNIGSNIISWNVRNIKTHTEKNKTSEIPVETLEPRHPVKIDAAHLDTKLNAKFDLYTASTKSFFSDYEDVHQLSSEDEAVVEYFDLDSTFVSNRSPQESVDWLTTVEGSDDLETVLNVLLPITRDCSNISISNDCHQLWSKTNEKNKIETKNTSSLTTKVSIQEVFDSTAKDEKSFIYTHFYKEHEIDDDTKFLSDDLNLKYNESYSEWELIKIETTGSNRLHKPDTRENSQTNIKNRQDKKSNRRKQNKQNFDSKLNKVLEPLYVIVGSILEHKIPNFVFKDEDGNMPSLNMLFLTYTDPNSNDSRPKIPTNHENARSEKKNTNLEAKPRARLSETIGVPPNSWVKFNRTSRSLYGMPLEDHIGRHRYVLALVYKNSIASQAEFDIYVQQRAASQVLCHEFEIVVKNLDYKRASQDVSTRIDLVKKIALFFNDQSTENIMVTKMLPGSVKLAWSNLSLPIVPCPLDQLQLLIKHVLRNPPYGELASEDFQRALKPYSVSLASFYPRGSCANSFTDLSKANSIAHKGDTVGKHLSTVLNQSDEVLKNPVTSDDGITTLLYIMIPMVAAAAFLLIVLLTCVCCYIFGGTQGPTFDRSDPLERKEPSTEIRKNPRKNGDTNCIPIIFANEIKNPVALCHPRPILADQICPRTPPPTYAHSVNMAESSFQSTLRSQKQQPTENVFSGNSNYLFCRYESGEGCNGSANSLGDVTNLADKQNQILPSFKQSVLRS